MQLSNLKSILTFYAVSPIHAGSGDSTATVDLPIQRERHTNYPVIHSSGVKGAMRDHFRKFFKEQNELKMNRKHKIKDANNKEQEIDVNVINFLFGADEQDWDKNCDNTPGAFSVSDAKILAFPMRSNIAPFVWVTCPAVLKRLATDLEFVGVDNKINIDKIDEDKYICINGELKSQIILEDAVVNNSDQKNGNYDYLKKNFNNLDKIILISDTMFDYCVNCTEIQTNIKIDSQSGTASDGGLRYQEFLPADSVLYSVVYFGNNILNDLQSDTVKKYIQGTIKDFIQIGGDETLGKGICKINWIDADVKDQGGEK